MSCMRNWYECLVEDPFRYKRPVHIYMIFSAICYIASFCGTYPILLIGRFSEKFNFMLQFAVYTFIGIPFWIGVALIYPVVLLAVYLIAIFCKNYLPLMIVAILSVVSSVMVLAAMIFTDGFTAEALLMIISILVNLWFSVYFVSVWKYLKWERKRLENS